MISPFKLTWNGKSTLDMDVWTEIAFDSEQGATSSFLNKESVITEHYDGSYRRVHSYKYNEVMLPRITFIKQDYSEFTPEENRKMLSWLTGLHTASWLDVYHDDSNVVSYRLFGNFVTVDQHKIANGRIIGYECDFESSSPYAWSRKIETTKQISEPTTFEVTCNSDEVNRVLYPKVTITFNDENIYFPVDVDPLKDLTYVMIPNVIYSYNGNYSININSGDKEDQGRYAVLIAGSNIEASEYTVGNHYYFSREQVVKKTVATTDEQGNAIYVWKIVSNVGAAIKVENTYTLSGEIKTSETIVSGGAPGEVITLDGTNKVIFSDQDTSVKIIGDDFNLEWLPLAYGKNVITATGNCTILLEWIEPIKVGNL